MTNDLLSKNTINNVLPAVEKLQYDPAKAHLSDG